ncbi:hypothetical protein H4R19_006569 [Coemansia spiralis]|nr:hypothetical protein H4R19_006569 [Coemansia spiralis]
MRLTFVVALIAAVAVAAAGSVDDEREVISRASRLMAGAASNDAFIAALQQLASVLGDTKATSELRADTASDEFRVGLHSLLADINRAMWVFNDDTPTLEHLRAAAKRIRAAL